MIERSLNFVHSQGSTNASESGTQVCTMIASRQRQPSRSHGNKMVRKTTIDLPSYVSCVLLPRLCARSELAKAIHPEPHARVCNRNTYKEQK